MSVRAVKATIECDACGNTFQVDLDPAEKVDAQTSIMDRIEESIKDDFMTSSIVDGLHLCQKCTKVADDLVPDDEDYQPTRDEVLAAIGALL
jgi:transcription elongation factor Elf1